MTDLIQSQYSKYNKDAYNSAFTKKQKKQKNTQIQNAQKTWIDIFPMTYRWPTGILKDAQNH